MGRRSSHDHYKDHILSLLKAGKMPSEILAIYPDLPLSTAYRWLYDLKKDLKIDSNIDFNKPNEPSKLVALAGYAEQSDIALARSTLRGILKERGCPQSVKVQAALGLMKLAYLRSELPKHIVDEEERVERDVHQADVSRLTEDELMARIREKLQAP